MLRPSFIPRIRGVVTVLTAGGAWSVFGLLLIAGAACAEVSVLSCARGGANAWRLCSLKCNTQRSSM